MRTLVEKTGPGTGLAIALLSGSYTEPEDLVREGFIDAVRQRGLAAEVMAAGVRAAHFSDGGIVRRIRESIVAPLRARGHDRLWIAGISLGALAALCHAARHEDEAQRRVLLSPYPGTREILREIDAAGSLDEWRPEIPASGDPEREAWGWLRGGGGRRVALDCWFGSQDRFVEGQRRIAAALLPESVHEHSGGHEWKDWRRMWDEFLEGVTA